MSITELIDQLREHRQLQSPEDVEAFEEALSALAEEPQAAVRDRLPELFLILSDECEFEEILWELVHFIEDFDYQTLVSTFVDVAPQLMDEGPEWVDTFLHRILNNETTRTLLRAYLPPQSASNGALIHQLLEEIGDEDAEERAKVDAVLS